MARAPQTPKTPAGDPPPVALKRTNRNPEFEIALGTRIRAARLAVGMNQTVLGEAIGISFQQVQKYELGKDRVAVSTLQAIATALGVHPGSFFDEDMPVPSGLIADVRAALRTAERIQRIRDPAVLKRLLAFADALAEAEDEHPAIAIDENGEDPGVRLRKVEQKDSNA